MVCSASRFSFRLITIGSLLLSGCLLFDARASAQDASTRDAGSPPASAGTKDEKPSGNGMVKLKIDVLNPKGTPVANASVYVRFPESGGFIHHDKLAEMNFKTNQDGSVKVPPVPQGKVEIQVIAPGWHTFGQWYDIDKEEQTVTIKLQEPPHWY